MQTIETKQKELIKCSICNKPDLEYPVYKQDIINDLGNNLEFYVKKIYECKICYMESEKIDFDEFDY